MALSTPNDVSTLSQSRNGVYPTAIRLAILLAHRCLDRGALDVDYVPFDAAGLMHQLEPRFGEIGGHVIRLDTDRLREGMVDRIVQVLSKRPALALKLCVASPLAARPFRARRCKSVMALSSIT